MAETHHDKPQTTQTHFQLRDKHVCILLAAIFVVLGAFAYQSYQDWQAEVEEANRQTQIFLSGGPRISSYAQIQKCIDGVDETFACKPEHLELVKSHLHACLAGRIPFEESPFAKRWTEQYQYYFTVKE